MAFLLEEYNLSQDLQRIIVNSNVSVNEQNKRLLDMVEDILKDKKKVEKQIKGLRDRTYKKFEIAIDELSELQQKRSKIKNQILRGASDYELGARKSKVLELSSAYRKLNTIIEGFKR